MTETGKITKCMDMVFVCIERVAIIVDIGNTDHLMGKELCSGAKMM